MVRRLELWTEIMELNDQGEYVAVEIQPKSDVRTGGIYQIRQVRWLIVLELLIRTVNTMVPLQSLNEEQRTNLLVPVVSIQVHGLLY